MLSEHEKRVYDMARAIRSYDIECFVSTYEDEIILCCNLKNKFVSESLKQIYNVYRILPDFIHVLEDRTISLKYVVIN